MAAIDFGAVRYPPTEGEQLSHCKQRKIREINTAYTEQATPLVKDYPELEQQSWTTQNTEATAYLEWYEDQQGEPPATPLLEQILLGRNGEDGEETMYEICLAVRNNADMFTQFQRLTGRRQRLVRQVREAETLETAESIVW